MPAPTAPQHEITRPGPLLDERGAVREAGFSRRPLLRYDPTRVRLTPFARLNRLRTKEWDFYATTTDEMSFATAVAHGGLAGVVFAQLVDLHAHTLIERSVVTPLGWGCALPLSSEAGDVRFSRGDVEVALLHEAGGRRIRVRWPRFHRRAPLEADLALAEPPSLESMTIATPIGARGFYFNRKMCCLPTSGTLTLGARRFALEERRALSCMDWGRGVWPYRTFWIWATGSGYLRDGRTLGINLGAGFGDLSAATENAIFVDGRMSKLGRVSFDYDEADPAARPWRLRDEDGRLDLTLSDDLYRMRKRMSALVIASDLRQITGIFRGHVVADDGERIAVDGVIGWAEVHHARW